MYIFKFFLRFAITLIFVLLITCSNNNNIASNQQTEGLIDIQGSLMDKESRPLQYVMIQATPGGQTAYTLADGSFLIKGIKANEKVVLKFHHLDYSDTSCIITAVNLPTNKYILDPIVLSYRFCSISGKVVDFSGAPLSFAGVSLENRTDNTIAQNGNFSFNKIEPGQFKIFAAYPGMGFGSEKISISAGEKLDNILIRIDRNGGTVNGTLSTPGSGGLLKALLKKNNSNPLVNASVSALGGVIFTNTDSSGNFSLKGVPSDGNVALTVISNTGDTMQISGIRAPENNQIDLGNISVDPLVTENGISMVGGVIFANTTDSKATLTVTAVASGIAQLTAFQWDTNNNGEFDTTTSSPRLDITTGSAGTRKIAVKALTTDSLISAQTTITLVIKDQNISPFFIHGTSWMTPQAIAGKEYRDTLHAADLNNDQLFFSLIKAPSGMTLSDSIVIWVPGNTAFGPHNISVQVTDQKSSIADTLNWTIVVIKNDTLSTTSDIKNKSVFGTWELYTTKINPPLKGYIETPKAIMEVRKAFFVSWSTGTDGNVKSDTIHVNNGTTDYNVVISDTLISASYTNGTDTTIISAKALNGIFILTTRLNDSSKTQVDQYFFPYAGTLPPPSWITADTSNQSSLIDTNGPVIKVFYPVSDTVTTSVMKIAVSVNDKSGIASVMCSGMQLEAVTAEQFTGSVSLVPGINKLPIIARDILENITTDTFTVFYNSSLPGDTGTNIPLSASIIEPSTDTLSSKSNMVVIEVKGGTPTIEAAFGLISAQMTSTGLIATTVEPTYISLKRSGAYLFVNQADFDTGYQILKVRVRDLTTGNTVFASRSFYYSVNGKENDTTADTTEKSDILIFSPSNNDSFNIKDTLHIKWSAPKTEFIYAELTNPNGQRIPVTMTPVRSTTGSFGWIITDTLNTAGGQPWSLILYDANNYSIKSSVQINISGIASKDTTDELFIRLPVNGDTIIAGKETRIDWMAQPSADVSIMISNDSALTWKPLVNSISGVNVNWTGVISSNANTRVLVQLVSLKNDTVKSNIIDLYVAKDLSADTTSKYLKIINYKNNDTIVAGKQITLNWDIKPSSGVSVIMSRDSGLHWETLIINFPSENKSWTGSISANANSRVLLRLVSSTDSTLKSNVIDLFVSKNFSSDTAYIKITSPVNGGQFVPGSVKTINWNSNLVSEILIRMSVDTGNTWSIIHFKDPFIPASITKYNATLPSTNNSLLVQLVSRTDTTVKSNIVKLNPAKLTIVSPSKPTPIASGKELTITWTSQSIPTISIRISKNSGPWETLVASLPASINTWTGVLSSEENVEFDLQLISTSDTTLKSNVVRVGVFTHKIISPSDGDTIESGNNVSISWQTEMSKVTILSSEDLGKTWQTLASSINATPSTWNGKITNSMNIPVLLQLMAVPDTIMKSEVVKLWVKGDYNDTTKVYPPIDTLWPSIPSLMKDISWVFIVDTIGSVLQHDISKIDAGKGIYAYFDIVEHQIGGDTKFAYGNILGKLGNTLAGKDSILITYKASKDIRLVLNDNPGGPNYYTNLQGTSDWKTVVIGIDTINFKQPAWALKNEKQKFDLSTFNALNFDTQLDGEYSGARSRFSGTLNIFDIKIR